MRISKPPAERRAELVAAARALFDEKGVEKTRVSDIVRRVGVAQGVFYYYFKSKNEVVDVVAADIVAEIAARRDEILGVSLPFALKLRRYIALYADWVDGFLADDAINTGSLDTAPLAHNPLMARGRTLLAEGFVTLVTRAAQGGELALAFPGETARVLLYGIEALSRETLPQKDLVYAVLEQGLGLAPGILAAGEGKM